MDKFGIREDFILNQMTRDVEWGLRRVGFCSIGASHLDVSLSKPFHAITEASALSGLPANTG